eukprot:jgi/Phyca11/111649/e_gw1.20.439.1
MKRRSYSSKEKMAYVKSIREGKDVDDISEKNGVPARNLFRWVGEDKKWREGGNEGPYTFSKRCGPGPSLPKEAEANIHD